MRQPPMGLEKERGPAGRTAWIDKKPGTGNSLHTQELVTVASFRTWRGWRECVARDRYLTQNILALTELETGRPGSGCPTYRPFCEKWEPRLIERCSGPSLRCRA